MFADKILESVDELARGLRGWSKADHSEYFPIVCPHSEHALALHNGSLMSVIKLEGFLGQYFPSTFNQMSARWSKFLRIVKGDKTASGFDLFWSYEYDPEGMQEKTLAYRSRVIKAAAARGLNCKDIFEEEAELYGKICAEEQQYIIVVTHLDSLPKTDRKKALELRAQAMKSRPFAADGMLVKQGVAMLTAIHEQHVNKVATFLKSGSRPYAFQRLDCYESMYAFRHSFIPSTTGPGWRAKLVMRDVAARPTEGVPSDTQYAQTADGKVIDWTTFLPPKLAHQMVPDGVVDLGQYVVVGDRTYAPMYISELAVAPEPLEELLLSCYKRRLPVRLVYSLMSDTRQANYWNRLFASWFSFISSSNRQISVADKAMAAYEEKANGATFGYGVAVTTWAKTEVSYDSKGAATYTVEKLAKRQMDIETLLQQWGGQQVDNIFGCPVEGLMSATPGYMVPPAVPKAPQIEDDIVAQLPIMRSARVWEPDVGIWMRSPEGVLMPYAPFTSKQNTMISIVLGGMGYGKSNFISENIYTVATHPDSEGMPYIRGMDFGASSAGVIDMVVDSLPEGRKHEAMFKPFANIENGMVKNILDTPLGMFYPLESQRGFIISLLTVICDRIIDKYGVGAIVALLEKTLARAYDSRNTSPDILYELRKFKPFELAAAPEVVQRAVKKAELELDGETDHWDVVRGIIKYALDNGDDSLLYAAKVAQRYAVPEFADLITSCQALEAEYQGSEGGKEMVKDMVHALQDAHHLFPVLRGRTNIDISESRICVFDMTEVFGRGDTELDHWKRTVFFAVGQRLLTEDLFINKAISGEEMVENADKFGLWDSLLAWHLRYLEKQDALMKLYWADEVHRLGPVRGAMALINSMTFEGRKYKVGILLGTQLAQYLPEQTLSLATSVFLFGASQSSEIAKNLQQAFDLSDDERQIVLDITKPSAEKGAEVFVIHRTDAGVQHAKLFFHAGGCKRWAYATEADERRFRSAVYAGVGDQAEARRLMGKHVKDFVGAVKKMQQQHENMSRDAAIDKLGEWLVKQAKKN